MLNYAKANPGCTSFLVVTESGILHEMQKACPEVEFIPVPAEGGGCNECEYMRMNTLQKLYDCIRNESGEIFVDQQVSKEASAPIQRMLEMS